MSNRKVFLLLSICHIFQKESLEIGLEYKAIDIALKSNICSRNRLNNFIASDYQIVTEKSQHRAIRWFYTVNLFGKKGDAFILLQVIRNQ